MRSMLASRLAALALLSSLAALGGCGLIEVVMTSAPDTVQYGEPVTFDIKFTNRSQCPTTTALAALAAFIPLQAFEALSQDVPPDAPPEIIDLVEEIQAFFDELCAGGSPTPPELPATSASCAAGNGEMVCVATGPAPAHQGSQGAMTVATLGDRLRCEIDAGMLRCELRLPLPDGSGAAASGRVAAVPPTLSCLEVAVTGDDFIGDVDAICFVGTFPDFEGLAPGEMATGQITLPARGSGVVRNLLIGASGDAEDYGVCKGGTNPGDACDRDESGDCEGGGTCGEGICVGGGNEGLGCDQATEAADCPGGTCALCSEPPSEGFLPIDCTTTYVSPTGAPVASPWALAALAGGLFIAGLWWQRRARRA